MGVARPDPFHRVVNFDSNVRWDKIEAFHCDIGGEGAGA